MSKNTIFGEEHFIDTQMIKLVEQRNNAIDNYVFEQMDNVIKGSLFVEMPQVEIDKEKLKKWVILCMKLENIEHSELVDIATKKTIADIESKLTESEENIKILEEDRIIMNKTMELYVNKCENYEQQLAEKEKELNDICHNYDFQINDFSREVYRLQKQLAEKEKEIEKLNKRIKKQVDNSYTIIQNCKELQIEQLEKLKDIIYRFDVSYDEINNLTIALDNYTNGFHKAKFKATILIDNQIKQIKEGK